MFPRHLIFAAISISSAASFVLFGYEFIRSVSSSLFIEAYGAENLMFGMVAVPPSMIVLLYCYGRLLSWLGATRSLAITSLFSALLILVCYAGLSRGMHLSAAIIYVFREAYIVIIIEQFWSFVNSVLTTEQAKRINGPFCAVASLGSFLGGTLVSRLAPVLGTEALLLFTAASLVPTAILGVIAYKFGGEPKPSVEESGGKLGHIGVKTLFRSRYLIFIGVLIISTQVVSTVLDLRFNALAEIERPDTDLRTAFFGTVYGRLGLAAGILQLVAVPLALRFLALRYIHLSIPIVHFVSSLILTVSPSLRTGTAAYVTFKALDYSLFRAGKELFYMPLSYDSRYRAKQVIDSFGYRFSKGGSAGVLVLVKWGIKTIPGIAFSITAMVAAMVWTPIVFILTRMYQKLVKTETGVVKDEPESEQPEPEVEAPERVVESVIDEMKNRLSEAREKVDVSIEVEKQFQDAYEGAVAQAEQWQQRARINLQTGREDFAREDLKKRNEHRRLADQYKAQWEEQKQIVRDLNALLEHLQQKIVEAERKKVAVVAKHRNVDAEAHLREMLKEIQDSQVFATLEKMDQDATEAATLAKAATEIDAASQGTKSEREFASYAEEAAIDKDIADLKAKLQ